MKTGSVQHNPLNLWRLAAACLVPFSLWGCNPAAPIPDAGTSEQQQEASKTAANFDQTARNNPDFPVKLHVSSKSSPENPQNGLQLAASMVEFSVNDCASGYMFTGLASSQESFHLYRYDQSCKVYLDSFVLEGQIFTPMPGQSFNPSLNAENQFIGDAGRLVIVRVLQQLPQILDTLNASVSFFIVEKSLGQNFNIEVYAVGLESSLSSFVESPTGVVPITVRRGLPAKGTLRVALQLGGTADPLLDLTSIPNEVEFQDGISEVTFNVRALPDDPYDDMETLQISIAQGPYFITDASIGFTIRDQSHRPPVWNQIIPTQIIQDDELLSLQVTATDPDGDPVYYAIDSSRTNCGTGWTPSLTISQTGWIEGTPGDAAIGSCLLAITASSLGGMITQDISITVLNRPENPVWTQLPSTVRIFEGESLDVTFTAIDPDPGASVSYSIDPASSCFGFTWNPLPTIGSSSGRVQGKPATATGGRCVLQIRAQSQGTTITHDFQVEIARRSLVWLSPSGTPINTCVPVSLKLSDGLDQYIEAPATATISLVVNNGSGTFYSSSSCTSGSTITSISWPVSSTEVNFYFRSTTTNQNLTLVATGGTYEPGFFNIFTAAAASKLLVSGPARTVVNQCVKYRVDQASSTNVKVISTSNRTVSFTLGTGMQAYSDAFCSSAMTSTIIPAYETGQDFYVLGTSQGSRNVSASASGLTSGQMTVQVLASRTWWNSAWVHRLLIQLDNTDQAIAFTNQPVLIKLTPDRFPYAQANADGSDLRFINSTDTSVLPHQIEQWVPGGTSLVWVQVDQIPASSALGTIYLYYGNAGASLAEQATTLWSAYAGVWHLSESPLAAIPQFKDSTSNARHGRAVSNPQSLQGPIGHGVGFMGNLDHIELTGFDLAPLLGRTATFSAWVKTKQVGGTIGWSSPALTGVEHNGTANDIQYGWLDNTGRIGVTAGNTGSAKSNFVVNDDTWRHVTITRNETNGAVAFYVNGVQNGAGTSESGFKSTSFNRFGILWDTSGTHRNFNGYMDEIRISSGLMSADRIRADYKFMIDTRVYYLGIEDY